MKLHEALRKILKEFGSRVLMEKRLVFLLADHLAFDGFPAMKEVMKAVAAGVWGKDLYNRSLLDDREDSALYAEYLWKSLARTCGFREEFARYAAECLMFALGFTETVTEPSDHGFSASCSEASGHEPDIHPASDHAAACGTVSPDALRKAGADPSPVIGERTPDDAREEPGPQKREAAAGGAGSPQGSSNRPYHAEGNWLAGKNNAPIRHTKSGKAWRSGGAGGRYHPAPPEESFPLDPGTVYKKGEDFYFGRGVPQNYEKAAEWYRKAADLGNADAMYSLAVMYSHGRGVQKDLNAAGKWRRQAESAILGVPEQGSGQGA